MSNKLLGLFGVIGGACLTFVEIRHLILGTILNANSMDTIDEFCYAIWGLGAMFAFWGIFRLEVTGSKFWMRWTPLIAAAGSTLLALSSFLDSLGFTNPQTNPIFIIALPVLLIGLFTTAILTLVSRKWSGWRMFTPLIIILALVVGVLLGSLTNELSSVLFGLSWILLGFAVLSSEPVAVLQEARA
jgi:hypothetical protein